MSRPAFRIDKGIPIPIRITNTGITEAMRKLDISVPDPVTGFLVGDSFWIPPKHSRTGLYVIARNLGIKITVRTENGGQRIWRLA